MKLISSAFLILFNFSSFCSARQIASQKYATLDVECSRQKSCPELKQCLVGECRKVSNLDTNCESNCVETEPICGSDGNSYNSTCDIEKQNCLHGSEVYPECHHGCPCDVSRHVNKCDSSTSRKKLNAYFHQRSSGDFAELLFSSSNVPGMFMNYVHQQCHYSSKWAFSVLDFDQSGFLEETELVALFRTFNDPCIVSFVNTCDRNKNRMLSVNEWCYCLRDDLAPCFKALNQVPVALNDESRQGLSVHESHKESGGVAGFVGGSFVPLCDEEGFFLPTQMYNGQQWCVDEVGNTIVSPLLYSKATSCALELQLLPYRTYFEQQWNL